MTSGPFPDDDIFEDGETHCSHVGHDWVDVMDGRICAKCGCCYLHIPKQKKKSTVNWYIAISALLLLMSGLLMTCAIYMIWGML